MTKKKRSFEPQPINAVLQQITVILYRFFLGIYEIQVNRTGAC